jgi:hypothetical protein
LNVDRATSKSHFDDRSPYFKLKTENCPYDVLQIGTDINRYINVWGTGLLTKPRNPSATRHIINSSQLADTCQFTPVAGFWALVWQIGFTGRGMLRAWITITGHEEV